MKNVVLTGLPGAGKTTIGHELSQRLGMDFADIDTIVEERAGMSIAEIFETYGEEGFRQREVAAAAEVAKLSGTVVSTGGGVVLRQDNMSSLSENGLIVFLDRSPDRIAADLTNGAEAIRPLLARDVSKLYGLAERRRPLYQESADITIEIQGDVDDTLRAVLEAIATNHNSLEAGYSVIGSPISHSLSPRHYNSALRRQGRPAEYSMAEVRPNELAGWVDFARWHMRGFNVTMPHKEAIIPLLDRLTGYARLCGSVNTVTIHPQDGELVGHNTDLWGIERSLEQAGLNLRGKNVVIAGAGGAARTAAVFACVNEARLVTIAARSFAHANALVDAVSTDFPGTCMEVLDLAVITTDPLRFRDERADIFINATPLGMYGHDDFADFSFLDYVRTGVFDMIYNPKSTRLLQEAQSRGLIALGGMTMLAFQAEKAEEIFFRQEAF
ncbi:MAG: hypothetical protein FWE20_07880 [Defluviitaleaceae bacterium]|nr:hypothetical protein [Defluviitaleaceae bacterium]